MINKTSSGVLCGFFGGFLGDEKALKEIFSFKGAAGTKFCMSCLNVVQFLDSHLGTNLVGIECHRRNLLVPAGDNDIYSLASKLADHIARNGYRTEAKHLEQAYGITFDKDSLLFDPELREIVRPVSHYLRDWMHVLVSHGAAGTEVNCLLHVLVSEGFSHDLIVRYAGAYILPRSRGRLKPEWFTAKAMADDNMRLFGSELLSMMPVLQAFLHDVVVPRGLFADQVESFDLMMSIVHLLQSGPSAAASRSGELGRLVERHHVAYIRAYGPDSLKPKWHHMLHVHEHGEALGRILSCFVTERKHRAVKACGTWAFKNYEHTVLRSMLYKQVAALSGEAHFQSEALLCPKEVHVDGLVTYRAVAARIVIGEVRKDDVVSFADGTVHVVRSFTAVKGTMTVCTSTLQLVATSRRDEWTVVGATEVVSVAAGIVHVHVHANRDSGVMRILL